MRRLRLLLLLPVLAMLGGCAVYPAAPVYGGVYSAPRPYYGGYGYRPYGYGYGYRPYGYGWRRW